MIAELMARWCATACSHLSVLGDPWLWVVAHRGWLLVLAGLLVLGGLAGLIHVGAEIYRENKEGYRKQKEEPSEEK